MSQVTQTRPTKKVAVPIPANRPQERVETNSETEKAATCSTSLDGARLQVPLAHKIVMSLAVVAPFLGVITAIILLWQVGWMGWLYLGLFLGGWLLTGLGITVGFHRLLTHRSFETYGWMRAFWASMGALAIEGSPLVWCAVHRKHHQHSDEEGDPHSPHLHGKGWWNALLGFVHAHTGWLFGRVWSDHTVKRFVPDLLMQPMLVRINRNYLLFVIASLAIPALIGGLATMSLTGAFLGLIWGGLVRIFFTHHVTWSINSICHIFGSQDYDAGDDSRNNLIFGILGHGEGWHNNHHAFPTSARHGLKWWQFDLSWLIIRGMQMVGLAWNVRLPSDRLLNTKRAA